MEDVLEVQTSFKLHMHTEPAYDGPIPKKRFHKVSGTVIFKKYIRYPESRVRELVIGGITGSEYDRLQTDALDLFRERIHGTLNADSGSEERAQRLITKVFAKLPADIKNNRPLEHEIVPIKLGITLKDIPVTKVSYICDNKPYELWVYGAQNRVYASKYPRRFTGRFVFWLLFIPALGWLLFVLGGS